MNEAEIIRCFASAFTRSPLQRNGLFECDAEIISIGDQLWALTMDEFTPDEDLFSSECPQTLGVNLAVATISDLLAAGATPAWFMHAVSLPKSVDNNFVAGLAEGISRVLREAGCQLCGGDIGCADTWRYCGHAMGPVPGNRPLTRILPIAHQRLWVTGQLGDANLAALTGSPTPSFELRLAESLAFRELATGCIDTSGGFFDALWTLHSLNPTLAFEIELDALPLASGLVEAVCELGFPTEAALLGGAGEYELLFAMPSELTLPEGVASCVGTIRPDDQAGIHLKREGTLLNVIDTPPPCPRDAATVAQHVQEVMQMAHRLFGKTAR